MFIDHALPETLNTGDNVIAFVYAYGSLKRVALKFMGNGECLRWKQDETALE